MPNTTRNSARLKTRKSKNKQAQARHTAKIARLQASKKTWQQAQGYSLKPKLAFNSNPKPKAIKTPVPYGVNNAIGIVQLAYAMPVYAIGTAQYTMQQFTINAIWVSSNAQGLAYCYVRKTKTNPPFFVYAHPHNTGFSAGLQQYTIVKVIQYFG